jgi:hypothetical protein
MTSRLQRHVRAGTGDRATLTALWRRNVAAVRRMTNATRAIRRGLGELRPPPHLHAIFRDYLRLFDRMLALNERGLRAARNVGPAAAGHPWARSGMLQREFGGKPLSVGLREC